MVIPLALGLVGKDGRDLPLALSNGGTIEHGVLVLSEPSARRSNSPASTSARCCRSIAASRHRSSLSPISTADDLAFLAAHDSDPFNRWQALQTISMRLLIDNVAALRAGKIAAQRRQVDRGAGRHPRRPALRAGVRRARAGAAGRRRYCARDRPRHRSGCDLPRAHAPCAPTSATRLGAALTKAYERMTVRGPYSPDAASAGRRALAQCRARSAGGDRRARRQLPAPRGNIMPPTT